MDANGLEKLLPKSIVAKRRRKKQGSIAETTSSNDEAGPAGATDSHGASSASASSTPRGRSVISREQTADSTNNSERSNNSMAADEGEDTSLISYDSDPELSDRPTIGSTHPSQIGCLTTSSPIVQAAVHLETQPSQSTDTPPSTTSTRFSSTFPVESTNTEDFGPAPTLTASRTGLLPQVSPARRSSSPVGRFRDVFKKKSSSGTGSPSPERKPVAESGRPVSSSNASKASGSVKDTEATNVTTTSERFRRLSQGTKIDTSKPPQTPPSAEKATPVIVNTPPTPTDPHHPTFLASPSATAQTSTSPRINASPQKGNMISQRRRAGSASIGPSKLSNIVPAPLTPTPENPASPGNAVSGFFSSMISTVQSTANTFSNSISTANLGQGGSRNKLPLQDGGHREHHMGEDSVEVESGTGATSDQSMDSKEPAIKTLGMGDLSLSQLGIEEAGSTSVTPMTAKFPDLQESARSRSESAPVDSSASAIDSINHDASRPRSLYEPVSLGELTPPQGSVYEGKAGVARSGSIRSAIAGRRKRGSSVATGATGGTIAAAIAAANASLTRPQQDSDAPTGKLSGFAVASKKRNRDFHALFKSVPDDDYLIEDYSCALQREILAHGRLYVSEGHLCFSSNIFGWITTLVMSFDEIVAVEKRSTALVFKNGLEISTLHAKHIFASFTGRDATYDLIIKIWKLGHPSLKSSLNGVHLDEAGGDRTEKVEVETESVDGTATISGSESESDGEASEQYDEEDTDEETEETTQATELASSLEASGEKDVARKPSKAVLSSLPTDKSEDGAAPTLAADFPGPTTHAPTDCGDAATHYDKIIGDEVIPAPLGKVYNLMFGPLSAGWMGKWLTGDQKCFELTMEDKKGLTEENKTRNYSYIKPLNSSLGPKQTKCLVTETLDNLDLEKSVNVSCSTQNPDVPSGNVFSVKTKYCLSWAENNSTRVQANCTIEWTGKSWLKGPIEKGANDGQIQYCKDLFASLKAAVVARPKSNTVGNGAGPRKRKGRKGRSLPSNPTSDGEQISKPAAKQDWGLLEPVRPLLSPFVDILKPVLTGNVVYGLLVGLLVATWFGFGSNASARHYGRELGYVAHADRIAAYEEMWGREESELWEWLETRVGLERLNGAPPAAVVAPRKRSANARAMGEKIREERMSEREIKEAIRVTEEKLKVLKSVVDKEQEAKPAQD